MGREQSECAQCHGCSFSNAFVRLAACETCTEQDVAAGGSGGWSQLQEMINPVGLLV